MTAVSNEDPDRFQRILERAGADYPAAVILDDDHPQFAGEFVRLENGVTRFGARHILIARDPDGNERSLWLTTTVLISAFKKLRLQKGETFAVAYRGVRQGANGEYKDYRAVKEGSDEVDWDTIEPDSLDDGGEL